MVTNLPMPFPVLQAASPRSLGSADSGIKLVLGWQLLSETQTEGS
jgi:hypothetical protein